jgi:hypothetical protein
MSLDSNGNVVENKYPSFILSLVDQWGSGYQVLIQGYGGPADPDRMRDMVAGLTAQGRVDWGNCYRFDRSTETSVPFLEDGTMQVPGPRTDRNPVHGPGATPTNS